MRIPLCLFALAVAAFGAEVPAAESPDQNTPVPAAEATKPAVDPPPPGPAPKYNGWVFSALADAYVSRNGNHPSLDSNQLQNFDIHSGDPRFSLGKFTID